MGGIIFCHFKEEEIFWHFRGKEILAHERLGDVFRMKFTYLGKQKGENTKCDVKLRYFESMTKKGHQKFWRMKRHFLGGKVTRKSVTCEENFLTV